MPGKETGESETEAGSLRRAAHRAVAALTGVLLLVALAPAAQASSSDQLTRTRQQLRAARSRLSKAKQSDAQLQATVASIAGQLAGVQARLSAMRANLADVEARMAATQRRMDTLDQKRRAYAASIGDRARTLYMMGPGATQTLLGSQSFADFVGRSTDMEFATRFDSSTLEALAAIRHEQERLRRSLSDERASALKAEQAVAREAGLVSEALQTQQLAEAAVARRVADYQSEVRDLAAEESRIEAIIAANTSVWTGAISRSGFAWPIRGPITSPYGPRWGGFHTGIDIGCSTGAPVGASKAGKVIASQWGGGYGWMIIIDHGGGITTLYAHASKLIASVGQYVQQHQTIDLCGMTGHATGPHVHFEVRVNGQHQNPMNFLP